MIGFILILLGLIGLALLFVIGFAFLGAWLWNITLVPLFGFPIVSWWHILALEILLWILLPGRFNLIKIGTIVRD